jgi:hypothetical protein
MMPPGSLAGSGRCEDVLVEHYWQARALIWIKQKRPLGGIVSKVPKSSAALEDTPLPLSQS